MVTADGAEIGRAQVMQAAAARVEPEAAMNPVLLKPGGDNSSQVVVLGRPVADVTALSYRPMKAALLEQVLASLADLRSRFDVVVCEGAGSPTEINLRADDIANMGLATAAGPAGRRGRRHRPRRGLRRASTARWRCMPPADQALVAGFLVNKFRGDVRLLEPGPRRARAAHRPPDARRAALARPASSSTSRTPSASTPARSAAARRTARTCCGCRSPGCRGCPTSPTSTRWPPSPACCVRYATRPEELADADLVVLPGTRATVADLAWLRATGLADAVLPARRRRACRCSASAAATRCWPARSPTTSSRGPAPSPGSGCCPPTSGSARRRPSAGRSGTRPGRAGARLRDPPRRGHRRRRRRAVPRRRPRRLGVRDDVARGAGERRLPPGVPRRGRRARRPPLRARPRHRLRRRPRGAAGRLGDLVAEHADTDALWRLIEPGPPAGLPLLPPGVAASSRAEPRAEVVRPGRRGARRRGTRRSSARCSTAARPTRIVKRTVRLVRPSFSRSASTSTVSP